jgi:Tfp pilus assembly protein PilN
VESTCHDNENNIGRSGHALEQLTEALPADTWGTALQSSLCFCQSNHLDILARLPSVKEAEGRSAAILMLITKIFQHG